MRGESSQAGGEDAEQTPMSNRTRVRLVGHVSTRERRVWGREGARDINGEADQEHREYDGGRVINQKADQDPKEYDEAPNADQFMEVEAD